MTKKQNNLEIYDPPVTILDPDVPWDNTPIANPFLILKLHSQDEGKRLSEPINNVPEFVNRKPYCVDWSRIGEKIVTLKISNLGSVASDLIKVNYQFVYCIEETHSVDEGFIHNHYDEQVDRTDEFKLFPFIPAESEIPYEISINPSIDLDYVRNLYFRARVSTLWEKPIKPQDWNVLTDKAVIESTHKS